MREEVPKFLNLRVVSHNKAASALEEVQNSNHINSAYQFTCDTESKQKHFEPKLSESPNVDNHSKLK